MQCRTVSVGADPYLFVSPIKGLFAPGVGAHDIGRGITDGQVASRDLLKSRVISASVQVHGSTPTATADNVQALVVDWRRSMTADVSLDVDIPGTGWSRRFYGRPRLDAGSVRLDNLPACEAIVELAFHALDPFAYGGPVSASDTAGTITLAAAGDVGADSSRATITVNGNGGIPVVTSTTAGGSIAFTSALAGGSSYVINLYDRSVVTGLGANADAAVNPLSSWFPIMGGVSNTITVTGAASASISYRPAFF